jgi:hypothetical protein
MAVTVDFDDYVDQLTAFGDDVAGSLWLNAGAGLEWSSAYLGSFPSFGVGLATSVALMPYAPAAALLGTYGGPNAQNTLAIFEASGLPLPAPAVEARVGGFGLPFDVGVRYGTLPDLSQLLAEAGVPADVAFDAFSFDVRLLVIEEADQIPAVSVGIAYERSTGNFVVHDTLTTVVIEQLTPPGGSPEFDNASVVVYRWAANMLTAKVQASKSITFVTPYLGLQVSTAWGIGGSGFASDLPFLLDSVPATEAAVAALLALYEGTGIEPPELTTTSIVVLPEIMGFAMPLYGGLSFDIGIVRLDFQGAYELISGAVSATAGIRLQFD